MTNFAMLLCFILYRDRTSPCIVTAPRRFPPPWSVEEQAACFVRDCQTKRE